MMIIKELEGIHSEESENLREKILLSGNSQYKGTVVYVSENGNDDNDGLSPENPIKSIKKINTIDPSYATVILFERGSIFRTDKSLYLRGGFTYGAYGEGNKPAIYGSVKNYADSSLWKKSEKENIWLLHLPYKRAGLLSFNNDQMIGNWCGYEIEMHEDGDYFHDEESETFYLYSVHGNPGDYYDEIEISTTVGLVRAQHENWITIENICFKYATFAAIVVGDNKTININNCVIGWIGGRVFRKKDDGTFLRYGNAIEFWNNCSDINIKQCWIYQSFDTALTWQGNAGCEDVYKDISFSDNLLEYNNADFEFYDKPGSKVINFSMDRNIIRFTSCGWGTRTCIRGIEGCIRAVTHKMSVVNAISFQNNVIDCPAREIINWKMTAEQLKEITIKTNKIFVKNEYRTSDIVVRGLQLQDDETEILTANNKNQLQAAFCHYDEIADLKWFD